MVVRPRWRTRRRSTASLLAVVATVALGVVFPLAVPAGAEPSNQPGGTSGVLDSSALDALQKRAAEVQAGLQQRQAEIAQAQQDLAAAQQQVDAAQAVVDDTRG